MSAYTQVLADMGSRISPEDENYREELLDVKETFRKFDEALDEFIVRRGYEGSLENTEEKVAYIRGKFEAEKIPLDLRTPRKWYQSHSKGDDRTIAFQFCFAFHLDLSETQDFFRRVYLQRGIDCHDIEEAIYYYCISHGRSYGEAQSLIEKAPKQDNRGTLAPEGQVLFTGSIIKELDRFETPEELLSFLEENRDQFGYNNATAKKYINQLWNRIAGENGIAEREMNRRYPDRTASEKHRSAWDIYLQIFGLLDYDREDHSRLFEIRHDRTLQPILKDNRLVHEAASKSFPDRQGVEKIIRGEYRSNEVIRKTLILLAFYRFWADRFLKSREAEYEAETGEAQRCLASVNRYLVDAGYPTLYEGNPYDWIFMYSAQDRYPMEAFRFFMREVYLDKEESTLQ